MKNNNNDPNGKLVANQNGSSTFQMHLLKMLLM